MLEQVDRWFSDLSEIQVKFRQAQADRLAAAAKMVVQAFQEGNKVLIFGNGGSAADAQHIAAEFVNRFRIERPPLPAIALTTDTSIISSVANDYGYDEVFVKQIKALGKPGDVALAISTSGRSTGVIEAAREARARGLRVIVMTGGDGGGLAPEADVALVVPSEETPHIQEVHAVIGHLLCELVDNELFISPGGEVD